MRRSGIELNGRSSVRITSVISLLFLGLVTLSGCQSIPKQTSTCQNLVGFDLNGYEFSGKLALSDGQQGGSGRFTWRQQNAMVSAQFKAPLGQGDWQIEETRHGATMVVNNEAPYFARYAEDLIEQVVGWPVPWQALKQWLTVQPLSGEQAEIQHDQDTKIILEQGWKIVYDRFQEYPQGCFPHRIMASKAPYSIRLVIREWQWL